MVAPHKVRETIWFWVEDMCCLDNNILLNNYFPFDIFNIFSCFLLSVKWTSGKHKMQQKWQWTHGDAWINVVGKGKGSIGSDGNLFFLFYLCFSFKSGKEMRDGYQPEFWPTGQRILLPRMEMTTSQGAFIPRNRNGNKQRDFIPKNRNGHK